jgi:hypothetical protein
MEVGQGAKGKKSDRRVKPTIRFLLIQRLRYVDSWDISIDTAADYRLDIRGMGVRFSADAGDFFADFEQLWGPPSG